MAKIHSGVAEQPVRPVVFLIHVPLKQPLSSGIKKGYIDKKHLIKNLVIWLSLHRLMIFFLSL